MQKLKQDRRRNEWLRCLESSALARVAGLTVAAKVANVTRTEIARRMGVVEGMFQQFASDFRRRQRGYR